MQAIASDDTENGRSAASALINGDLDAAEDYFEAKSKSDETDGGSSYDAAEALHLKAALQSLRNPARAIDACLRAVDRNPADPLGWSRLGHLYLRTGQLTEAQAAFQRAVAAEKRCFRSRRPRSAARSQPDFGSAGPEAQEQYRRGAWPRLSPPRRTAPSLRTLGLFARAASVLRAQGHEHTKPWPDLVEPLRAIGQTAMSSCDGRCSAARSRVSRSPIFSLCPRRRSLRRTLRRRSDRRYQSAASAGVSRRRVRASVAPWPNPAPQFTALRQASRVAPDQVALAVTNDFSAGGTPRITALVDTDLS